MVGSVSEWQPVIYGQIIQRKMENLMGLQGKNMFAINTSKY